MLQAGTHRALPQAESSPIAVLGYFAGPKLPPAAFSAPQTFDASVIRPPSCPDTWLMHGATHRMANARRIDGVFIRLVEMAGGQDRPMRNIHQFASPPTCLGNSLNLA